MNTGNRNIMNVQLSRLIEQDYKHSDEAEASVVALLAQHANITNYFITEGYQPAGDVGIEIDGQDSFLGEVKFQGTNLITIETSRRHGKPSGLSLSQSQFHLFVNYNRKSNVGKVRILSTATIRNLVEQLPKVSLYGGEAFGYKLNPFNFNDGWIGDIDVTTDDGLIFDTSRFIRKATTIEKVVATAML